MNTQIARSQILLNQLPFSDHTKIHYQLTPCDLVAQTIIRKQGVLNDNGALCINTGKFTGRSPKDKFIVKDAITENAVNWNHFNQSIDTHVFDALKHKMLQYLGEKEEVWIRDAYACANNEFRLSVRIINENPWSNLFAYNMFLRPLAQELSFFEPDWQIIQAPGFLAKPVIDGVPSSNFSLISFSEKIILIGGSGYTGEIKKGIFTVLNFLLPHERGVLSMHCSANKGMEGDVAIFFGLSGTGKTTLSADPHRQLIGDDEHGWDDEGVFNFEGGCYAKTIDLTKENEPEIFQAIREGALVENVVFYPGTNKIDFTNQSITENTRVSYPLNYISNACIPSTAGLPKNLFFLTCDAYGVLPPISKLNAGQAMYQFISGYTAKVAGTEEGIREPKATFSACFGAPFMPLHPGKYADLLGKKMKAHQVNVWMINTGWSGGPYGIGKRIKLAYTRAMIAAVFNGELEKITCLPHPVFGIQVPVSCPGVPAEILEPRSTWADKVAYDNQAKALAELFVNNFKQYAEGVSPEIVAAAPKTNC
jgi:phosphoenolpyruvate carboxykinase (ATP)